MCVLKSWGNIHLHMRSQRQQTAVLLSRTFQSQPRSCQTVVPPLVGRSPTWPAFHGPLPLHSSSAALHTCSPSTCHPCQPLLLSTESQASTSQSPRFPHLGRAQLTSHCHLKCRGSHYFPRVNLTIKVITILGIDLICDLNPTARGRLLRHL